MWKLPSLRNDRSLPGLPEGIRIYAIGDVHGRSDLLKLKLLQIEIDTLLHSVSQPVIILVGDYIDRGPNSKEVIDLLLKHRRSHEMVFLKGNHEQLLLKFLEDPTTLAHWQQCGGLETLISYGLKPSISASLLEQTKLARDFGNVLSGNHRQFLKTLKLFFICGDFLFVHAGLRPLVPIEQQKEDDLLWIRDEFLFWDRPFEKIVVHGHTPVLEPDIQFNRINIDTGAFATERLTCLVIEGTEITPLIDTDLWIQNIAAEISMDDPTPSDRAKIEHPMDAMKIFANQKLLQNPDFTASIHAERFKKHLAFYPETLLKRLDPRSQA